MAKEFIYGHSRNGNGAEFIKRDVEIPKNACYKYTVYDCTGNAVRVNFDPYPDKDLYMLVFTTNHPEGSSVESREQIFVHGYAFSGEEIDERMKTPELLFKTPYFASVDDYYNDTLNTLENYLDTKVEGSEECAKFRAYVGSVIKNTGSEMESQIYHIIDPFVKEKWKEELCCALNYFPKEIRKEISWCVNPYTVEETNTSELNYLSADVYRSFVDSRFEGGKLLDRIVLEDNGIQGEDALTEQYSMCELYDNEEIQKEIRRIIRSKKGDRKMFKKLLVKRIEKQENVVAEKDIQKSKKKRGKRKNKKNYAEMMLVIVEMILVILSGVFILTQFTAEYNPDTRFIAIYINNSVVVFLAQFVFSFLSVAVWERVKKKLQTCKQKGE